MKRASAIVAVSVLAFIAISLHSSIKDFLWAHPWWHSFLVAVPTLILGYLEWRESGEANDLRRQAIHLRGELDQERNKQLQQISRKMEKAPTLAERNASKLRQNIGANVPVTHGGNNCGVMQVAEVNEDNIATLFRPHGYTSSVAFCRQADCSRVQVVDVPRGSCPLQLTVLEWYGEPVELGEITKWEDRSQVVANPPFPKGGLAFDATYTKPGSGETRTMYVYAHKGSENSFLLESSTGAPFRGNNEEVSKQFLVRQVEYQAAGFRRSRSGNPASGAYPLFIC